MPDKQIIDLPALDELKDTDYLVVGRPSAPEPAQKMQGAQLVAFVDKSAQPHVTEATKQAQAAAASAQTATTKASDASQSATQAQDAQQKAATAQVAAEAAQGKAEAAQTAAESAKAGADTAKAAAETAQGKAEQALTGATDAKTAAETAQGKAETAKTEAESAKKAAETALQGANSSAQTASQAKEAAETAKTEAQKAQQAIEDMGVSVESLQPDTPPEVVKSIVQGVVNLLFKIPQGRTGPKGDIGPQGVSIDRIEKTNGDGSPGTKDTYTIYLDDGTSCPFQVLNGPQGPQGNGLTIKFTYDTLGELEAAVPVPELGMNAYIGTTQPYDVYSYTQTDSGNRWVDGGKLQGPEGKPGADGVSPTVEVTSVENGYQVIITDKAGPKEFDVRNGLDGTPGKDGKTAYQSAQDGGYTSSESQFNTDLAGVSSKQRVVDLGEPNFHPGSSSNVITADLASEQINDVFLDNQAPIVLFTLPGTSSRIAVLMGNRYIKGDKIAEGHVADRDNDVTEGSLVVGTVVIHGTEDGTGIIDATLFRFFSGVANGAVVSSNPIQLPADPTQPLEAATKQYVDNAGISLVRW